MDKNKTNQMNNLRDQMPGRKVYDDGQCAIWNFTSYEDFLNFPFRNQCASCLCSDESRFFEAYEPYYRFYIVDTGQERKLDRIFIVAMPKTSETPYQSNPDGTIITDLRDNPLTFDELSSRIPPEAVSCLRNGSVSENRCRKKTIRLSESDLHNIVKECVRRVLNG